MVSKVVLVLVSLKFVQNNAYIYGFVKISGLVMKMGDGKDVISCTAAASWPLGHWQWMSERWMSESATWQRADCPAMSFLYVC